jgi:hypothetical protein
MSAKITGFSVLEFWLARRQANANFLGEQRYKSTKYICVHFQAGGWPKQLPGRQGTVNHSLFLSQDVYGRWRVNHIDCVTHGKKGREKQYAQRETTGPDSITEPNPMYLNEWRMKVAI